MRVLFRLALLFVLCVLLYAARFRFDHIVIEGETYLVRVHRITGHADILIPGDGWVPAEDAWSDSTEAPPTSARFGSGRSFAPPAAHARRAGATRAAPATGAPLGLTLCRLVVR